MSGWTAKFARPSLVLPAASFLYILLSVCTASVTPPLPNEAWFFSPAVNLLRHGQMGTTNLVTHGTWLQGIEQRTYWVPPLHILTQSAWYLVAGAGLAQLRALSVVWGVLAVMMTFQIGRLLRLGHWAALLSAVLLATDFRWVLTGSLGRMDMMCASLGLAGIAAYLHFRMRSLPAATIAAHTLIALSCLTHPCGVIHGIALVIVTLCLDWRRLNFRLAALAAVPYAVALAGWGVYIAQDPPSFLRQFSGNISGLASEAGRSTRFSGLLHPWEALRDEIYTRYYNQFGNWGSLAYFGALQMYVLGLLAAAAAAAVWNHRQRSTPHGRALSFVTITVFCILWLLDGSKTAAYLPHILPWIMLLAGFGLRRLAAGQIGLVAALVSIAAAGQFAAFAGSARENKLQNQTVAIVRYLQAHAQPEDVINGGAELAFFAPSSLTLTDDPRLGFLTGRRPDWIVLSGWYSSWISAMRKRDAAYDRYVDRLLDHDSREVFHTGPVKVYRVNPASPPVLH